MMGCVLKIDRARSANHAFAMTDARIGLALSSLTDLALTKRIASCVGAYFPRSGAVRRPIDRRNRTFIEAAWTGIPDPSTCTAATPSPFRPRVTNRRRMSKCTRNGCRFEGRTCTLYVLSFFRGGALSSTLGSSVLFTWSSILGTSAIQAIGGIYHFSPVMRNSAIEHMGTNVPLRGCIPRLGAPALSWDQRSSAWAGLGQREGSRGTWRRRATKPGYCPTLARTAPTSLRSASPTTRGL